MSAKLNIKALVAAAGIAAGAISGLNSIFSPGPL